jgi:hypothetical protein
MIEQDQHKTAVIFRKWHAKDGGQIIALFPEIPSGNYGYHVLSYEHIGQHGAADYNGVMARTVPATEEEYAALKRELEQLGYNLAVYQRRNERMREKFRGRIL